MAILVRCGCGAAYNAADDLAGRKIRCKHCQSILPVPAPGQPVALQAGEPPRARPPKAQPRAAAPKADTTPPPQEPPGKGARKRKKRRRRADDDRALSLEERIAKRDKEGARGREVKRGLRYLGTGVALIVLGAMLTYLLAELAKGPEMERGQYGLLSLIYKAGGIWGPVIVFGIGGLIPCGLGIMNLMGIGIVVEEKDR
jgi:hypothetical protein